ncbi:MAG: zf-TFIIB domain-containing protein [Thermoleophilaceae bacterium]
MTRHGDMRCPACGAELVELERAGVRIDACRQCRGVWLDRGELDQVLERERQVVAGVEEDDESFLREMTGRDRPRQDYGLNKQTAERLYSDYRSHRKDKKRKSFLDELLG